MRKTQQTDAPQRLETCHDLGACLLSRVGIVRGGVVTSAE